MTAKRAQPQSELIKLKEQRFKRLVKMSPELKDASSPPGSASARAQ